MWINYRGYNDAQAQYRNFNIGDGRGTNIFWAEGSSRRVSVNNGQVASYTLHVNGDTYVGTNLYVGYGNTGSSAAMYITRVGGQATIKGNTTNGGDGQIVIDGASNSANVYLNNYVSSNVYLATGGGTVYSASLLPHSNNAYTLGSASVRWSNIYTNDLHLSNEGKEGGNTIDGTTGDWTIEEGEELLYIRNNKNGKKFFINLTEIK
jgi:hypothetical protein